jgi:hypothetical protein
MAARPLQNREVLKYENLTFQMKVFDRDMKNVVGKISNGDLVIVVGDEDKPFVKVMLPSCLRGWVRFDGTSLLRMDQVTL